MHLLFYIFNEMVKYKSLFFLVVISLIYATPINVAYVCNDGYSRQLAISIASLIKNKAPEDKIHIYVFSPDISDLTVSRLTYMAKDYAKLTVIKFDIGKLDGAPKEFHMVAYSKCLIPNLLSDLDSVIYLDVDTLVLGSLKELSDLNLRDNYAAVVQDETYWRELDLFENKKLYSNIYKDVGNMFNSGVMVLNLKKCRKDKIEEKFLYQMTNVKHYFGDQTIFYYLFYPKLIYLEPKWNAGTRLFVGGVYRRPYSKYSVRQIREAINSPKIMHFYDYGYLNINHKFAWLFRQYLSQTPWREDVLDFPNKTKLYFLHKAHWWKLLYVKFLLWMGLRDYKTSAASSLLRIR